MIKTYDLAVKTRSYKDKYGNDKSVWENIGNVYQNDNGELFAMIKATFNPAGVPRKDSSDRIAVSFFPIKEKDNDNSQHQSYNSNQSDQDLGIIYNNGDIPF